MAFLVSTTGSSGTVVFQDLGGRTLTHPVVDLDLELEFTREELVNSVDVLASLDGGQITVKNSEGIPITSSDEIETVAVMLGATGLTDGVAGLVPTPVAGDEGKFLRGDGLWEDVSGSLEDLPGVQIRNTAGVSGIPLTWTDLSFDATDFENDTSVIEHDNTNTDRILIKETGAYLLSYSFACDDEIQVRVRVNDSTVLDGSFQQAGDPSDVNDVLIVASKTLIVDLSASAFLTVQIQSATTAENLQAGGTFVATRLKGVRGEKGDPGTPGSGTTLVFEDDGVIVPNGPQSIADFVGDGVTVTDVGSSRVQIEIPGSQRVIVNAYESGGGQNITAGPDIIQLDTVRNPVVGFTLTGNRLQLTDAGLVGKYLITGSVSGLSGGGFTQHELFIALNGTEVPGCRGGTFSAVAKMSQATTKAEVDLSLNDLVDIRLVRSGGSGNVTINNAGAFLILEKVN